MTKLPTQTPPLAGKSHQWTIPKGGAKSPRCSRPYSQPRPGGPSRHSRGCHRQRQDRRTTPPGFAKLAVPRLLVGIHLNLYLLRGLHGTASRSCFRTREEWLVPLDINANRLAGALGVDRQKVYDIVNGKRGVSAEMALRLARWSGMRPRFWLGLQEQYDLAIAQMEDGERIEREVLPLAASSTTQTPQDPR